jgi:hypothetical protein
MPWLAQYLDVFNAEANGEAARDAERRRMYARPDAPPLPERPETVGVTRGGWLSRIVKRGRAARVRTMRSSAGAK